MLLKPVHPSQLFDLKKLGKVHYTNRSEVVVE
jgi:hypothetical protein